jgi:hypothetical protein
MSVPPQTPPDPSPVPDETESAEPTRTRRSPFVKVVAVIVALALVGGAGAVALVALTGGFGSTSHELTLTDPAGGMDRDDDVEQELRSQLDAAEQQFADLAESGEARLEYTRVGVYDQADEEVGPTGALVFIGAKSSEQQEPDDYIAGVVDNAEENGFETAAVEAGDDASGVCATQDAAQVVTICAWATTDTVGQLVPTVPGWTPEQLAPLMVDVRADVETSD